MKERFEKLSQLWSNLNAKRKFSLLIAIFGIIGLSVAILALSGGSTQMRVLVSGADSKDLEDIVNILKANQVEFEYSESGDTILVPEDKRSAMRMELAMKECPEAAMLVTKFLMKVILESVILSKERITQEQFKVNLVERFQ